MSSLCSVNICYTNKYETQEEKLVWQEKQTFKWWCGNFLDTDNNTGTVPTDLIRMQYLQFVIKHCLQLLCSNESINIITGLTLSFIQTAGLPEIKIYWVSHAMAMPIVWINSCIYAWEQWVQ